ncbi:hypothetical protein AVEN_57120-1 [Araneus ventricosus]|uniref:Uncharacterized protein n=1 Tax=Araneus ventricosus TaxID=182803 RepID=A0A4Y2H8W7_ARAVE|nr:hypothetical protein AVEN_57120-1 [Araneus ventricosus]
MQVASLESGLSHRWYPGLYHHRCPQGEGHSSLLSPMMMNRIVSWVEFSFLQGLWSSYPCPLAGLLPREHSRTSTWEHFCQATWSTDTCKKCPI